MHRIDLDKLDAELGSDTQTVSWTSAARSDTGKVRKVNEDAFMRSEEQRLWVVADGMGGHSRGDYASQAVVESLLYFSAGKSPSKAIIELDMCLKKAHEVCRNTFASERVGSTVAALHAFGDHCIFVWAGDSRIYRLRDNNLEQMTRDHTLAQQKCDRGELSPLMASIHPSANVLTRAVGVNQQLWIDIAYEQVLPGDRYLLCSDGLYNDLERKEIQQLLLTGTADETVNALIFAALDHGGKDNSTAIVLDANPAI